jgi:hypothetical protein
VLTGLTSGQIVDSYRDGSAARDLVQGTGAHQYGSGKVLNEMLKQKCRRLEGRVDVWGGSGIDGPSYALHIASLPLLPDTFPDTKSSGRQ